MIPLLEGGGGGGGAGLRYLAHGLMHMDLKIRKFLLANTKSSYFFLSTSGFERAILRTGVLLNQTSSLGSKYFAKL